MSLKTHLLESPFGYIFIREWTQIEHLKGIIHIYHGMMEHSGMYHEWAMKLNKLGWGVIAHDQPGSGLSMVKKCAQNHLPICGDVILYNVANYVEDWILKAYDGLPFVRYGHSMGAFVVLNMKNNITKNILTGLKYDSYSTLILQRVFLRSLTSIITASKHINFIHNLTFKPLSKAIKKPTHEFSWVSRNNTHLNMYLKDPLCANIVSLGYFYTVNELLIQIHESIKKITESEFLIITGEKDPLSKGGKLISPLIKQLKQGFNRVQHTVVPGSFHKIENDDNDKVALKEIYSFLEEL